MTQIPSCEKCSSKPAKIAVIRRRGSDVYRTFVCSDCAAETTKLYAGTALDLQNIALFNRKPNGISEPVGYTCRICNNTLADIVVDGKPGCCACYNRFAGEIEQVVEKFQGSLQHIGKSPF